PPLRRPVAQRPVEPPNQRHQDREIALQDGWQARTQYLINRHLSVSGEGTVSKPPLRRVAWLEPTRQPLEHRLLAQPAELSAEGLVAHHSVQVIAPLGKRLADP